LPLNTNGKVDRKALPAPKIDILPFAHQYVAPRTPIEETITLIWAEVLGLERIGIHDNFFELGGHSLLATQIISRVRTKFHTKIPLRAVFEATTVADLARIVEVSQWVQMSDTVEAMKKDIEYEDVAF
jgi:acyl carrier protein